MKSNFESQEFLSLLESMNEILKIAVNCQQYQDLLNSDFYSSPSFTLNDAVQAIEECCDAFTDMQTDAMIA